MSGFEIVGPLQGIEIIARGNGVRVRAQLNATYGVGNWRKLKAVATVRQTATGSLWVAEVHFYEAHGIGRREFKIKRRIRRA